MRKKSSRIRAGRRLEARVTADQKRFFQRAAEIKGLTLTDFVISSLHEASLRALEEQQVIRLSVQETRGFVQALLRPPKPNAALQRAAARYRKEAVSV